jgi:hypothetical protein
MSVKYDYLYFDVVDFTGVQTVSSYALSICPLTFRPNLNDTVSTSNKRILWEFGDNTTSVELTASHVYNIPGEYTVKMYMYDGLGESAYNILTRNVTIHDFIPNSISLSANNFTLVANDTQSNVFELTQTVSPYASTDGVIVLSVSGAATPLIDIQQYNTDKFAHLRRNSKFLQQVYNSTLNNYEFVAVSGAVIEYTPIYAHTDGNSVVTCPQSYDGAVFAGTSGHAVVSFVDSISAEYILISAAFDKLIIQDNEYNIPPTSTYFSVSSRQPAGMFISTTGLSAMEINSTQFADALIPFVVQVNDLNGAPCKYLPNLTRVSSSGALSSNRIQITLVDSLGNTLSSNIADNFGNITDCGIYRGNISCYTPTTGVRIIARAQVVDPHGTFTLSCSSNNFNIVQNDLVIYKIGEDYDATKTIKSYRFQENLIDKEVFFDSFLGSIVGNSSSSPDTLGIKLNERTENYVDNVANINTCNIPLLYSMKNMAGVSIQQFEQYNFSVPAKIARIMDICSINHSSLWGSANTFKENFDSRGHTVNNVYGTNRGDKIDTLTHILTAGDSSQPIIAYERFSGTYRLLSTDLLSSQHLTLGVNNTYALSSYNQYWGWGLVIH